MLVPFISLGGKTLYLMVIDICEYDTSASKRGGLKAHVLEEADLREVPLDKKDLVVTDGS